MTRLITDDMLIYDKSSSLQNSQSFGSDGMVEQPKIDIYKLISLGVILCFGEDIMKARVIYSVIQINLSEMIVLNDRMTAVFTSMIQFATTLMMKRLSKESL